MATLNVDVDAIGRNTEVVAGLLRTHGVRLVAVTKGCLGEPRVAAAMLAGGASALADARDANLRRLRTALPTAELHRIGLPSLCGGFEPGDLTHLSSAQGAAALAALPVREDRGGGCPPGRRAGRRRVMLQVETGDLREGVPMERLEELVEVVAADPRLELEGLATNYACFAGEPEGIRRSVEAVAEAASRLRAAGTVVERVSGGSSSALRLLVLGEELPAEVTELRCGEALLLGQDALHYEPLPGCRRDACVLRAEVLEGYTGPTRAGGRRLVLAAGRQDLGAGEVRFVDDGLREIGRSDDYIVVEDDYSSRESRRDLGDMVEMIPSYRALAAAWASPFVDVRLC